MKIQWLGTAAAEGWPAMFCQCEACTEAQKRGGRNLRSRSGALVDDTLLIDLNPDLLWQKQRFGLDLGKVTDIIITHFHFDHLTPACLELMYPVMAHRQNKENLRIYGSKKVLSLLDTHGGRVDLIEIEDGKTFTATGYQITPLPAVHAGCVNQAQFFLLQNEADGKALLYAHDTDLFCDEAWQILSRKIVSPVRIASLDCTNGPLPHSYIGHMGFAEDIITKNELLRRGMADENTLFVCNHFSHNGKVLYEEATERMKPEGFAISYDGMIAEA